MHTLFDFYKEKGQALPSVQERTATAQSAGITDYVGSAEQNVVLLKHLQDTSEITTIDEPTPIISSKDSAQEFNDNSDKIDDLAPGEAPEGQVYDALNKKFVDVPKAPGGDIEFDKDTGTVKPTGDVIFDKLNEFTTTESTRIKAELESAREDYQSLYTTSLASIDSTVEATIGSINATFDKRIKEQERINQLRIDSAKAYGLSRGGRFTPLAYKDAISNREIEAADKISALETQRNTLIAEARAARDTGNAALLRQRVEDLNTIDEQIRSQLKDVQKRADEQYTLLRKLRKEEEEKNEAALEDMAKRLTALSGKYADVFDDMTPEEQDALIQNLINQTGLDYATIFGILNTASIEGGERTLKTQKAELDIENIKSLIAKRKTTGGGGETTSQRKKREQEEDEEESKSNVKADVGQITGADGKVDPNKMQQLRQHIAKEEPDLLDWFDKAYPPNLLLDPEAYVLKDMKTFADTIVKFE